MKAFLRYLNSKFIFAALLIASIVLLCPITPAFSATASCNTGAVSMSDHGVEASESNTDCSKTHSDIGSHVLSPATSFDYLALLLVAFTVVFFTPYQFLRLAISSQLVRLRYYRHRYRVSIKPKLGGALLHWLNLLGGTVAFSF